MGSSWDSGCSGYRARSLFGHRCPFSLNQEYTCSQRACYQEDRAESSLERNLVEHLSTLQAVLLSGLGSPEVPKGPPWGKLEAGGGPGTPDSSRQQSSGFGQGLSPPVLQLQMRALGTEWVPESYLRPSWGPGMLPA